MAKNPRPSDEDDPFACFGDDDENDSDGDGEVQALKQENAKDDPFACFGDDDDTNNDENDNVQATKKENGRETVRGAASEATAAAVERARRLVEQTNRQLRQRKEEEGANTQRTKICSVTAECTEKNNDVGKDTKKDSSDNIPSSSYGPTLNLWPSRPPLYLNPHVAVTSKLASCGGGRGYVALEPLQPGTLILVEEPILLWPVEQIGKPLGLKSVESLILHDQNAKGENTVVKDVELLHPTKKCVDNATLRAKIQTRIDDSRDKEEVYEIHNDQEDDAQVGGMIRHLQREYAVPSLSRKLDQIVQLAKECNVTNSDGTNLNRIDILRILLVLRYNGFESGLYLHFAMLNHSCKPNCIKFLPEQETDPIDPTISSHENEKATHTTKKQQHYYSEVRTTQFIPKGERLTIHYMNPREVCHATKRYHLWDQHKFDIGNEIMDDTLRAMDLIHGNSPVSSIHEIDKNCVTFHVEKTLAELEDLYQDLEFERTNNNADNLRSFLLERSKEFEATTLELCHSTKEKLGNPNHILLVRCYKLHIYACDMVLQLSSLDQQQNHEPLKTLTRGQRVDVHVRSLRSLYALLFLQKFHLNIDHIDMATTYHDIAETIAILLSLSPQSFYREGMLGSKKTNFEDWSREEYCRRKEYERIKALYPRDVDRCIVSV